MRHVFLSFAFMAAFCKGMSASTPRIGYAWSAQHLTLVGVQQILVSIQNQRHWADLKNRPAKNCLHLQLQAPSQPSRVSPRSVASKLVA